MSNNTLANPLQSLISRAAKSLPATTGATDEYRRRLDNATDATAILCDCSGSMDESAGGGRKKIDHLRDAMADVMPSCPADTRVIAFSSVAGEIAGPHQLPPPSGGTALHLAFDAVAGSRPRRTLVISDGKPDDEAAALAAAGRLTGIIDVIYCGPDSDAAAIAFMRSLARAGGGRVVVRDLTRPGRTLTSEVRGMLLLPGA